MIKPWKKKKLGSIIEAQQLDLETLEKIFSIADKMEKMSRTEIGRRRLSRILRRKMIALLFYEPSTRTRFSFQIAMKALGGEVVYTENARVFSSAAKGESLEDTIRVINSYPFIDAIVLRYDKEGGAKRAYNFSAVPIINAGDGIGQHPTQAILDVYTIKKHFYNINNLKIAMVGDLYNGRTVRSLCYLLGRYYSPEIIYFVSPPLTRMRDDIKEYLDKHGVKWIEIDELDPVLREVDVFYITRVQSERFKDKIKDYERVAKASRKLIIDENKLSLMKFDARLMHPLPRVSEIDYKVDKDKRAIYFEQAGNGLFARMAILKMMLAGY